MHQIHYPPAPSDYSAVNETVTIDPLRSNNYLTTLPIFSDDLVEGDETFVVELRLLSSSAPVEISPSRALVVIVEVDEVPDECQTGQVRLGNNATGVIGRVEVCVDGRWSTVCDSGWDYRDAVVVCTQLGLPAAGEHIKLWYIRSFLPSLSSSLPFLPPFRIG